MTRWSARFDDEGRRQGARPYITFGYHRRPSGQGTGFVAGARISKTEYDPANLTRCLFLGGWDRLALPATTSHGLDLRPAASVDLSRAEISEILGSTFAHCSHLQMRRWDESVSEMHFAARGAHPANLAVHCSSLCGHATLHINGKKNDVEGAMR